MNREQLAHIVRAAATIAGDGDIVIIGSQAILGAADVGWLPEEATMSMEADLAFRNDIDAAKADAVDGAIGELSQFHETYGYYAQGVEIRTAVLPAGWEDRAEILDRADSRPGFARCLEPHDLVVSKLVAGREKDISYAKALIGHGIVKAETLHERAEMLAQPKTVVRRVRAPILRCTPRQ
jgi:hypothetical protein